MNKDCISTSIVRPGLVVAIMVAAIPAFSLIAFGSGKTGTPRHQAVKVIDGDSVQIGAEVFDLDGIDAPELGQICLNGSVPWHCGLDAAYALIKRFVFDPPSCRMLEPVAGQERKRRRVICMTGGLPAAMVLLEDGYAAVLETAMSDYQRAQQQARRASLGIWRGKYIEPVKWREGIRLAEEAGHGPECPVKTAGPAKGGGTFYVPFDPEFVSLKVSSSSDGQCFGSEEAAGQAGYKRPLPRQ